MGFSQKIYYNDKQIVLTTDKEEYIQAHPEAAGYNVFTGATLTNYNQALHNLEGQGTKGVIVEDTSEEVLYEQLHAMYRPIDAAGGVVFNERGDMLMIYRRGKWDLPKGKRDDGENMDECALREVKEETGLNHLAIAEKICDTYHIYSQYGEHMLKRTAWYKMRGDSADKLQPQKEENILEARWVTEQDMGKLVRNTYDAIREVLRLAGLNL